jgi:protein-S-isoprenylcysteine O-methyltransferase Ste14
MADPAKEEPEAMGLFLKNLAFVILVPGILAVWLPVRVLAGESFSIEGVRILGLCPLILGAACMLWCVYDFWKSGRGTPAPIDPPKALVVKGFYRYVRNPMYIGVLSVVLGEAICYSSWSIVLYGICASFLFHGFIILYEEPALTRTFGQEYLDYKRQVPRWFPSLRRILLRRTSRE